MNLEQLSQIAQSQVIWAICCIVLAGFILKKVYEKNDKQEDRLVVLHDEYREESKERETESRERENKLMAHLTESNRIQERTSNSLIQVEKSLISLEENFNSLDDRVSIIERKNNV